MGMRLFFTCRANRFCELLSVADDRYGFSDVEDFGVASVVGMDETLDLL